MKKSVSLVIVGFLLAIFVGSTVANPSTQKPAWATPNPYTIMPLGASITAGDPLGGGYRIKLWQTALKDHWNIHFVGSLSNGPASLGDKHHEGHSGYQIDQIAQLVDNRLATYKPRMILLYIG